MRYKLTIAYDGTDFCGWQKQEPPAGGEVSPSKILEEGTEARRYEGTERQEGAEGVGHQDIELDRQEGNEAPRHRGIEGEEHVHGGGVGHQDIELERQEGIEAAGHQGIEDRRTEGSVGRIKLRTVQAVVERAVREVVREPVMLLGASRTDSGVHARGQVAAFSCSESAWPESRGAEVLVRAINSRMPDDVLVVGAEVVPEAFHPIADCTAKGYSYTLHVSPHRAVWDRRFVHHVWVPLDVGRMNEGAARMVGEHDFAAFAAAGHGRVSTVRRVFECRVVESETARQRDSETGKRLRIEVSGNGFLWNMVRIISGTLVEVGRGKLKPEDVSAAIESKDRRRAGPTLPPTGLCLEWVRYGP